MIRHRAFIPALARLLKDDCRDNITLLAIIIPLIASFSLYIDFHQELLHNHIGSSIMTLLDRRIMGHGLRRSDENLDHSFVFSTEIQLLSSRLTVLYHLSDDPSICQKCFEKDTLTFSLGVWI